jgi:broad specificity phosphatase PhoE
MAQGVPLLCAAELQGAVFILRHGRSLANEAEIVVSSMANGVLPEFALAAEGVQQAAAAGVQLAAALAAAGLAASDVRIVASPFSRTRQTAETVAAALGLPPDAVEVEPALRERFFGAVRELGSHRRDIAGALHPQLACCRAHASCRLQRIRGCVGGG